MNKSCLIGFLMCSAFSLVVQAATDGAHITKTISQIERKKGIKRTIQYRPDGNDFVCVNGKNRYTRALYGGITDFRIETSDRPVFAAYKPKDSKHICFRLQCGNQSIALDSLKFCEARYRAGRRTYRLTDPLLGKGELNISVLAFPDAEGGIWRFTMKDMPEGALLHCYISEIRAKNLSRNGDMGADRADSFDAPQLPKEQKHYKLSLDGTTAYIVVEDQELRLPALVEGTSLYDKSEKWRSEIESSLQISTPDPYFNPLGGALAAAADGIWDGKIWLHGAIGWRSQLNGWRAAYIGDFIGWHDRARTHFDSYAASQVTDVPATIPHPTQDTALHLARSVKKWGTPHYSNGYICRTPYRKDQMHHYDMNLCYIDELLWHFNWTGDLDYVRKMWLVLTSHLAWEKLNYDPDNDGLYDAYCCIWASDALYYNSGAVTHSSAYNYRANKLAAMLAEKIGEDATPYEKEADKILKAMNERLWIKDKGHWAEFQDFMGHKRLHESAGLWTIYHAIDSETADPFQAYQATRYVDTSIPHIPVFADGLDRDYETLSTTNWMLYVWSVNNVAFAEVMHTALAFFQAGRGDDGFNLLKGSILDGMYLGKSPGNFGQISLYDAVRRETYRDFADQIGITSRTLIQGLYGVSPDALNGKLVIRPGFPMAWDKASMSMADLAYEFLRKGDMDIYNVTQRFKEPLALTLQVNAVKDKIRLVKVNGKAVKWKTEEAANGYPLIVVSVPAVTKAEIEIQWEGNVLQQIANDEIVTTLEGQVDLNAPQGISFLKVYDPQNVLVTKKVNTTKLSSKVNKDKKGHHTFFVYTRQGNMEWWQPVNVYVNVPQVVYNGFENIETGKCRVVNMDKQFNSSVADIFKNEYLSPRSPYTTLQLPTQGIGEWCHPLLTAEIDDSGLRSLVKDNMYKTSLGIPFRVMKEGNNIAYTSLWDNYPDMVKVPLSGKASHAYLLLVGSTNHMQCRIANGIVRVYYTDGTSEVLELVNPDNWCPIEQDFYLDDFAFDAPRPRPYRFHLKTGIVSRDLGKALKLRGSADRRFEGGAGVMLDIPLDKNKTLKELTLETVANDVVIGLMSVTLQ